MIKTKEWNLRLANLKKQKQSLNKKNNTFVSYRLLAFMLFLVGIFVHYKQSMLIGNLLCIFSLLLFVYLVLKHSKIKKAINQNQLHMKVIQKYLDRRSDAWMKFEEKGEAFVKECDFTFLDLDIISDHSLYQLLCVAKSALGKRRLYEFFAKPTSDIEIIDRREAIEELATQLEESICLQIALEEKQSENEENRKYCELALENFLSLTTVKGLSILRYLPIITIVLGILCVFSICPYIWLYIFVIIQFMLSFIFTIKEQKRIKCYQNMHIYYAKDVNLYKQIENLQFKSEYAQKVVNKLLVNGKASILLRKLDTSLSMFSLRNNIIMYVLLNALCMFDIQYLNIIENWRKRNAQNIKGWRDSLAEIEALLSCSLLLYARDKTCIPNFIKDTTLMIHAKQCAHPLINESNIVYNDFTIKGCNIITGSNMSGKSTFIRCVGLNVILANAGCRVCADEFSLPFMHVISSMRLKDELSAGISSFYAEVLRMKQIMQKSKEQIPILVLIDEIFKGTNSLDRIAGAKEVIHKLNQEWIISMITTHDLELCDELDNLNNFHFKEQYINHEISFDYLLQKGKCKTTNAIHLMKLAGIID